MHLPPTRWLVSSVSTQWVQHILGSRRVGPIRLMCWALHMHHSLVGHTQFVFKVHHLLKAINKHVLLSTLYSKKYWKSYCFFPKRHQSNLESDQNTIPSWHGTGKRRFFLQKCHNISTYAMTSQRWRNPWMQGPYRSNIFSTSQHLLTYLLSTLMGQSVGLSIHVNSPKHKIIKMNSRNTLAHYYFIHHGVKMFYTWDAQESTHVVQMETIFPISCSYHMA